MASGCLENVASGAAIRSRRSRAEDQAWRKGCFVSAPLGRTLKAAQERKNAKKIVAKDEKKLELGASPPPPQRRQRR
jgi:hypothetical protein